MPRTDGRPTAQEKRDAKIEQTRLATERESNPEGLTAAQQLNQEAIRNPGAVQDAKGPIAKPSSAGAKVTVGCRLGIAYYDLQLCKKEPVFEQNMQGGRTVDVWLRVGNIVRIRGTAYPRGQPPDGFPDRPEIVGGASLTRGVDKEWFDEWLKQHARDPVVMNGMIFAHESNDHIIGMAKETAGRLSGLEPINQKGDPRITKSTRSEISNIETEEGRAKKARLTA